MRKWPHYYTSFWTGHYSQYTRRALCTGKHTPSRCIPVTRTSRTQFFIALLKKGHHWNFWHLQSKMQNISCVSTALSNINSKPCVYRSLLEGSCWMLGLVGAIFLQLFDFLLFSSDLFWHRAEPTDSTALCALWVFQQSHCVSLHQSCPCLRVLTFSAWRKERKKPRPSSKGMPRKWVETGGRFTNPAAVLTLGFAGETARQIIV